MVIVSPAARRKLHRPGTTPDGGQIYGDKEWIAAWLFELFSVKAGRAAPTLKAKQSFPASLLLSSLC